jgi:hypothetical protein
MDECLPLLRHAISQKTHNNQSVFATLSKTWEFAVPFSFVVLGPNKFLFKLSKPEHLTSIQKQVTWNVNGSLIILQQWHPQATLNELPLHTALFWIQVHGLPLINMTTKIVISIGKGLGNLIKVEDISSDKKTFRSFFRLLVEIEVCNPLKPGFTFHRDGGESLGIFLKYDKLDIYYNSCGKVGHKLIHCNAPPKEKFPEKNSISFQVNIFSNLLPTSPLTKINPSIAITPTKPSSSQFRSLESFQVSEANLIHVPNTQTHLAATRPLRQKISQTLVTSPHTSTTLNVCNIIPSISFTIASTLNAPATIPTPPQPLLHPIS